MKRPSARGRIRRRLTGPTRGRARFGFADSSGVILAKAVLERLGVNRGQKVIATPVPGAVVLISDNSLTGEIVSDALSFMEVYDDAFGEMSMRRDRRPSARRE